MSVHLVKHKVNGVGYAKVCRDRIMVRFWNSINVPIHFPLKAFASGSLKSLGEIGEKEKDLFFT